MPRRLNLAPMFTTVSNGHTILNSSMYSIHPVYYEIYLALMKDLLTHKLIQQEREIQREKTEEKRERNRDKETEIQRERNRQRECKSVIF